MNPFSVNPVTAIAASRREREIETDRRRRRREASEPERPPRSKPAAG
jgi:hypothetical protein